MINCVYWFGFFPYIATHRKEDEPLRWLDVLQAVGAHFIPLCMVVLETFDNAVGFWNWKRISPTVVMFFGYLFINVVYTVSTKYVTQRRNRSTLSSSTLIGSLTRSLLEWLDL